MASHHNERPEEEEFEEEILEEDDAAEEIDNQDDDVPMDSDYDDEEEVIILQNDSVAHFDRHTDSVFSITSHPRLPNIIATGGGDDVGYVFDSAVQSPVLPASYSTPPQEPERQSIEALAKLDGHSDSICAIAFTQPAGQYLVTGGLDGRLRVWKGSNDGRQWKPHAAAQEVEEINWIATSKLTSQPNAFAVGASDGSVWVYQVCEGASNDEKLVPIQTYFPPASASSTAGAWSPSGVLLATVSDDGSFNVYDPFGEAAAKGLVPASGQQSLVSLGHGDERFRVEGGLFSVTIGPTGSFAAMGGADGEIKVVGMPRPATPGAKGKAGAANPGGQLLASLNVQKDSLDETPAASIESIAFAAPSVGLMAAACVDGSISVFDTSRNFALRRYIQNAHDGEAVISVKFVGGGGNGDWLLTSCGYDGVIKRWNLRGGAAVGAGAQSTSVEDLREKGLVGEWKGHRGGGEGGGVLGFVQHGDRSGNWVVTAGDDGVSLIFLTPVG
ncbi:WD40 repeat-like protein [Eremomyces bilateralis CBS 781.70]|uniref:WD40 repeat-like protein n=1 Tax=Eremomyces bilateralis CBS 781.70 TaxID=1392243 RepID=A0A6G1GEI2_9PEZI|nr:WD40 repeat-like protein [Eremomyces bilateralis CBS 781.70]KAF1816434.1 WD40 repeat-like protein [Eremomyces bilateralis CBS 781.70]